LIEIKETSKREKFTEKEYMISEEVQGGAEAPVNIH
jgi:hypothetical protein